MTEEVYLVVSITPIPALDSNYFWVIRADDTLAYIIDPGAAAPVMDYLKRHNLTLGAMLITHHHRDHTMGIAGLLEHWPIPVYGPISDRIPQITHRVQPGDTVRLKGIELSVLGVSGHTLDHIAYINSTENHAPQLFCGDALFAAGCGRRFEGSADVMWDSLMRLASLPDHTLVYCAHEYTLENLRFAAEVEPFNLDVMTRLEHVSDLRNSGMVTLPSTIELEKSTNPFLRCQLSSVRTYVEKRTGKAPQSPAAVFELLRAIKDNWPSSPRLQ